MKTSLFISLVLTTILCPTLLAQDEAKESGLPKVLIIGDSISLAFTPHVARQLDDKAAVMHNEGTRSIRARGLGKV
ncbi:hypothetical protein RBWH47_01646, partial [Rhodopirellula baltica WH47]